MNADEARQELHEALGPQPDMDSILDATFEGWKPEPGDKLVGTVLTVGIGSAGEFGPYPLLEVVTEDGENIAVHCFHQVLRSAVESWQPKAGERIGIKYNGKTERGSFGGYEDYRMVVIR